MAFPYNSLQSKVLAGSGHQLVLGQTGSGKTMLVIDKAAHLLTQGVPPARIGMAVFAFRGVEHLKSLARDRYPTLANAFESVRFGTLRDLAAVQLVQGGKLTSFIGNNQVRTYLRFLMAQQGFSGTLNEAEHIIRSLKSRAKKVPENDRHYPLFKGYKDLLDSRNQADRHDIIRNHIIAMRAEGQAHLPPVPVDYLLVDNVQDATELQTIWLKAHAETATLFLTANDDVTAFTRDGALGTAAIAGLQEIDGGRLLLVGMDLDEAGPRVIVDGHMSYFPAGTSGRISSVTGDTVTGPFDAAEFLGIHVQHFAGFATLVAHNRFDRIEGLQAR